MLAILQPVICKTNLFDSLRLSLHLKIAIESVYASAITKKTIHCSECLQLTHTMVSSLCLNMTNLHFVDTGIKA